MKAEPKQFELVLDENDMRALNLALGEIPYRIAAPLVVKINQQIAAQIQENNHADHER